MEEECGTGFSENDSRDCSIEGADRYRKRISGQEVKVSEEMASLVYLDCYKTYIGGYDVIGPRPVVDETKEG